MRSSSRLSTAASAASMRGDDCAVSRACALRTPSARGSNRAWNSSHDLRGDARVLDQRRPHVVLRIRHADLAQEARDGADQRDIAPRQAGRQHQRVVAVVLGAAAHHHDERRLQRALAVRRARPARRRSAPAPCRAARRRAARAGAISKVRSSTTRKPMFSSTGTRSDSGIGRPWLHTLRPTQRLAVLAARDRNRRRAGVSGVSASIIGNVGDRHRRRIGLAIAGRERFAIARQQRAALLRLQPPPARRPSRRPRCG